uniref:Uncharacterized protein n=1 Tax=Ananas comosus var. bracteatus TaxID=296719 RepID=A0A6V7PVC9_ANACO|nr:unnamed protein product [Ananas comosus var. bracteatus]
MVTTKSKFLLPSNGNIEKWVLKSLNKNGRTSNLVRYWFSEKSKEKENVRESGRVKFFALAHKRKNETYDESFQEVLDNITKLIEKEAKTENEVFTEVIGSMAE